MRFVANSIVRWVVVRFDLERARPAAIVGFATATGIAVVTVGRWGPLEYRVLNACAVGVGALLLVLPDKRTRKRDDA